MRETEQKRKRGTLALNEQDSHQRPKISVVLKCSVTFELLILSIFFKEDILGPFSGSSFCFGLLLEKVEMLLVFKNT